jgi:hypothetical protein
MLKRACNVFVCCPRDVPYIRDRVQTKPNQDNSSVPMAPRTSARKAAAAVTSSSAVPAKEPEDKKTALTKLFDATFRAVLGAKQRLIGTLDPDDLTAAVLEFVNEMV